ncbi:unnamed protein product [Cladocopium goreaui]|uniref:IPT/TIG domain-containing protein n=1 Tax=Cladocopium goreaui TaxID=2562237 RepID=A0A9P1GLX1_9DINO|nr:unnamed protein product [Cladocopium goreaui]
MQSSPSVCRVSSTGPSGRAYILNLSWVSLTTARCGPLTTSHPFPSLHRLKLEVSPNGVQWFLAPRPITLFEQPQFHSISPLLAAVNSSRWITLRGIGFPRGVGLRILVEISPGFFRQALRVNSTALRFRSPTSSTAMNASIWVTFGGAPAKNTGFILRLVDSPSVTSVSPPAISVGEPQGTDTRRPINIYGLNFRDTDECIFQSASMVQPERVPLYSYISSTHVQCRAPGVALSDALVPPYTPEEVDACEVYAYLQTRINSLRDQVNAMKIEQFTRRDSDRSGCFGDCEETNLSFFNGTLQSWYSAEQGMENETEENMSFDLDNLSYQVSLLVPTAEQVALERETDQLIFEANVEYLKCIAQQAAPATVQARARGGFLLAQVWSPDLLDQQLSSLSDAEAFPVRLLPRLGISFVTPDSGPVTGGTLIAVVGNGFTQQGRLQGSQDDNLYMPARYFNESLIYCTTPAYHPAGVAKLKVASWLHELSLTSVDFTFYPRWIFSLREEAACFAGARGDSVVLYASEAEFVEWRYSVYKALCLFTTVGPPTRVFDAEATIYAWNSTMRVVCPCPALSLSDTASDSINVSISLDGKATISEVLGQPVRILKAPEVHHMAPSIWTVGSDLDLVISGANFPSDVEMACVLYDHTSQGYTFESFKVRQESMWRELIEDSCPAVPEADYTHQWQDVREPHCALAGANVSWDGALAFIPADYVSSGEVRCNVPSLAMTMRGHMMTNRSLTAYLVAKKNTGYLMQVAELPDIYILPRVQIRQVDPEVSSVVEKNDTSSVEPLLIQVMGEEFFLKHMARSDQRRFVA